MKVFLSLVINLSIIFFLYNSGFSQDISFRTIDTAEIVVTYSLVFVQDSLDESNTRSEAMLLLIGEKHSVFMSMNSYNIVEKGNRIKHYFDNGRLIIDASESQVANFSYRIYKNYKEKKIVFTDFVPFDSFLYEEDLNTIKWVIINEKKKFLGYNIQKAVTNYGGRNWVAWFTPDIPINEGPYKFYGLPGLILEIRDSKNHFVFRFNSIKSENNPIQMAESEYIITTRKKFHEYQNDFNSNFWERMGITSENSTTQNKTRRNIFLEK